MYRAEQRFTEVLLKRLYRGKRDSVLYDIHSVYVKSTAIDK